MYHIKKQKTMIILLPILILILIFVVLIILTLKVSKRLGYKEVGYGISTAILIIFLYVPFSFVFDGFFFSKSDAKNILEENRIVLLDDFEFERKSISGIMDYILDFKIRISESDKNQIIETFKTYEYRVINENFQMSNLYSQIPKTLISDTILFATYKTENFWNLERIKVIQNGYMMTNDIIQISKNENNISVLRNE